MKYYFRGGPRDGDWIDVSDSYNDVILVTAYPRMSPAVAGYPSWADYDVSGFSGTVVAYRRMIFSWMGTEPDTQGIAFRREEYVVEGYDLAYGQYEKNPYV